MRAVSLRPRIRVQLGRSRADALGASQTGFVDALGAIIERAYPAVAVTVELDSGLPQDRIEILSGAAEPDEAVVRKLVDFAWSKYRLRAD